MRGSFGRGNSTCPCSKAGMQRKNSGSNRSISLRKPCFAFNNDKKFAGKLRSANNKKPSPHPTWQPQSFSLKPPEFPLSFVEDRIRMNFIYKRSGITFFIKHESGIQGSLTPEPFQSTPPGSGCETMRRFSPRTSAVSGDCLYSGESQEEMYPAGCHFRHGILIIITPYYFGAVNFA